MQKVNNFELTGFFINFKAVFYFKTIIFNPKPKIMKSIQTPENDLQTQIVNFATKNYKIYLNHYKTRKMSPMPFEEFLKNYT